MMILKCKILYFLFILIHLFNILQNLVTYNAFITTNTSILVLRHSANKLLVDRIFSLNNELYDFSQALMDFDYINNSFVSSNIIDNIKKSFHYI